MNPSEFQSARQGQLKTFEEKYAVLKSQYSTALQDSISETDRTKQSVLIKAAMDSNEKLTALVQEFLVGSDSGGCKLTPQKIRSLREDIETYKKQYGDIQQGRDKIYALQQSYNSLEQKIEVLRGVEFIYLVLLALGLIVLIGLVFYSGVSRAFNTQSIPSIIPGGFAKPSYF